MSSARRCLQSTVHCSLLIACLLFLAAALLPSAARAQQSTTPQTDELQAKSCCSTCGSCNSGPSCPAGYAVYDDYCLPECPGGYLRYPGYPGICLPPTDHGCPEGYDNVPLPNCPQGYHRNLRDLNECLQDQGGYPGRCPKGLSYSQETGRCSPDCPEGTYLAENGLCRSYYARACPVDYKRDPRTGACVPGGDWPADYRWICLPSCPQDFTRDIYLPTRCLPPPENCPQGFENFRQQCVPVCEQGTLRNAYGYCVPPRCEDGTYPNLRGVCQPTSCPDGNDNIRGQCFPACGQGFAHNLSNPAQCDRIPRNEPQCPGGSKFNVQTGECERVPPPPANCKQGLLYNPKTKQCEPPPRAEKDCPKGLIKLKSGKCARIEKQPECEQGFALNPKNGNCEPVRVDAAKPCPDGMVYNRKRQRCVPPEPGQEPDEAPAVKPSGLNNGLLRFLTPNKCPKGTAPDKSGNCVPVQ